MIKKIDRMHALFGVKPCHKCGECCNFVSGWYMFKILRKRLAYGLTHSQASDWAKRWTACGLFGLEYAPGKLDGSTGRTDGLVREQRMKLVIPGTLPGLNQYIEALDKSHYAGASLKKEAQRVVEWCAKSQLWKFRPAGLVWMKYTWYEPNKRRAKGQHIVLWPEGNPGRACQGWSAGK